MNTFELTRKLAEMRAAGLAGTPEYQSVRAARAAILRAESAARPPETRALSLLSDWNQAEPEDVPAAIARAIALYFNHEVATAVEACERAGVSF